MGVLHGAVMIFMKQEQQSYLKLPTFLHSNNTVNVKLLFKQDNTSAAASERQVQNHTSL